MTKIPKKFWWILLAIIAVYYPLSPLLPVTGNFDEDWYHHLWLTGYLGQYLSSHGHWPLALNATNAIGTPIQSFYGFLIYPLLSLFSLVLGPNIALRCGIILFMGLQFFLVYRLILEIIKEKTTAFTTACLITWAIYPMTNIYNRGALAEFFATTCLVGAVCSWLLIILCKSQYERRVFTFVCGLMMCFTLGSHPITAIYAIPFSVPLIFFTFSHLRNKEKKERFEILLSLGLTILFTLIVISPWAYLNWSHRNTLEISSSINSMVWYLTDIDLFDTRFALLPFDKRSLVSGKNVGTPYLDAQMNMPLLILVLGSFVISLLGSKPREKSLSFFTVSVIFFIFASILSLSPEAFTYLPQKAAVIQFGYRFITYQNLMAFLALIALMLVKPGVFEKIKDSWQKTSLITICLTLALCGVFLKYQRANVIRNKNSKPGYEFKAEDKTAFLKMHKNFNYRVYNSIDIPNIPISIDAPIDNVVFNLGTGENFSDPQPLNIEVKTGQWFKTNVVSFDWNKISVGNEELSSDQIKRHDAHLAIWIPAGQHTLVTSVKPDPALLILRGISFYSFVMWVVGALIFIIRQRRVYL
ncbi:MAG: hypothetical protein SGI74_09305 [Oligoflexia bacterium]|nr:hypothetical protein [Oligoflexia bacterium]